MLHLWSLYSDSHEIVLYTASKYDKKKNCLFISSSCFMLVRGQVHSGRMHPEAGLYLYLHRALYTLYTRWHRVVNPHTGTKLDDPEEIHTNEGRKAETTVGRDSNPSYVRVVTGVVAMLHPAPSCLSVCWLGARLYVVNVCWNLTIFIYRPFAWVLSMSTEYYKIFGGCQTWII